MWYFIVANRQIKTNVNEIIFLNELFKELGTGLSNGDTFTDARWSIKRIGELFRLKGTRFGAEEFFREFFQQEETEIVYPKNNMFIVGESEIGYESLRYITDYARYQVYSLLIKTGLDMRCLSLLTQHCSTFIKDLK